MIAFGCSVVIRLITVDLSVFLCLLVRGLKNRRRRFCGYLVLLLVMFFGGVSVEISHLVCCFGMRGLRCEREGLCRQICLCPYPRKSVSQEFICRIQISTTLALH